MPLKRFAAFLASIFCLAAGNLAAAQTPPSMAKDPLGYLRYLQNSTDPQAVAVRKQIENGPDDLTKAKAAALKDGLVLAPAKLQRALPPEGQNAAPLYAKLDHMLLYKPLHLPVYAEPLSRLRTYTPEQIAAVQKIYNSRPEVWALIHQAADAPNCVFTLDWKYGWIRGDGTSECREAERLNTTETYLLATQGKYADAVQNQLRGFRIAGHAASGPTLHNYLLGEACDAIALHGMQAILELSGPNPEIAAQVREAVKANQPALSLRSTMIGETTCEMAGLEWQRRSFTAHGSIPAMQNWDRASAADNLFAAKWVDASEAIILTRLYSLIAASALPLTARRQAFAQPSVGPPAVLSEWLVNYAKLADHPAYIQCRETVLLAGAAAMGAWTKDGGFPVTLPGAFTDPFTDKPLGYRREGANGFVVYSTWPDGTFDGGKPGDNLPSGEFVFRYPIEATPMPPYMLKRD